MADNTDSGITNLSGFRGNFGVKVGTWTAGPGSVTIASGGTAILMGGANLGFGLGGNTAVPPMVDYSFENGNPNMTVKAAASGDAGTYYMIIKLS